MGSLHKLLFLILFFALLALPSFSKQNVPVQIETPPAFNQNPSFDTNLSLDKIFADEYLTQFPSGAITLVITGDILLARTINAKAVQENNFTYPFELTKELTTQSDIIFINLETPLVSKCPISISGTIFCGDTRHIEGLKFAGIDVVNLANNHSTNYGQNGLEETKRVLTENGIIYTGISGPVYKKIKNTKFAFLGYNDIDPREPIISIMDEVKVKQEIEEARKNAEFIVVAFHWGVEYTSKPNTRQIEFAHLSIDSGADLVIGHHPHWIQPIEIYKNRVITYSHGNFIFDQFWSQKTREGIVSKFIIYNNQVIDIEFLPVYTSSFGKAKLLESEAKNKILNELKTASVKLSKTNQGPR